MGNLAYDYLDEVTSGYIGLYLDDRPGCTWDELEQLPNQYIDFTSAADAARDWKLSRTAYKDATQLKEVFYWKNP